MIIYKKNVIGKRLMSFQKLTILGTMSGTSLDGIDLSVVETNGKELKRCDIQKVIKFDNDFKIQLLEFIKDFSISKTSKIEIDQINNLITTEYIKAIEKINVVSKCDFIGFHGQTIFHDAENSKTIQLGNAKLISNHFKKPIVYDFRTNDLLNGGQGAPIAPIYHKFLIKNYNFKLPGCILNIGGIANLSYWDNKTLIGFDTGPGNILLDKYMQENFNKSFDQYGVYSSKGNSDLKILAEVLNNNYFIKKFPKSLDAHAFVNEYEYIITNLNNANDIMSTLLDFTVLSIKKGINTLPKKPNCISVTGGGFFNKELLKRLEKALKIKIETNFWDQNVNNFLEADMIGYLTARRIYNLPSTSYYTTGTKTPVVLGKIYMP